MPPRPPHVLITGGSRGIGLATAHLFASKGYKCTLIARSEAALQAAVASLPPLSPLPPLSSSSPPTSTSTPSSSSSSSTTPISLYGTARTHTYITGSLLDPYFWPSSFGRQRPRPSPSYPNHSSHIDVLVNCAGISQASAFVRSTTEELGDVLDTNLKGVIMGTQFLLRYKYLRGRRGGGENENEKAREEGGKGDGEGDEEQGQKRSSPVIINVSSLLGVKGGQGAVAYAASKAGVLGFTRALASEYQGHGVRVNAVVPGYVETEMTKDLNAAELETRIPLGRFGTAEEIAHAIYFLAENEYAHNCVLNLDGGLSAV